MRGRGARRLVQRLLGRSGSDYSPTTAQVDGFTLHLPQHFRWHYVDQPYEPLSRKFLIDNAVPGTVTVDVGAHIGYMTLLLSRFAGPDGRVYSFEPARENLRYLRRNVAVNAAENVRVIAAAAHDVDGQLTFHLTGSSDSHGMFEHPNTPTRRKVTVEARRLDSVISEPISFFKIDTEGSEIEVLKGMSGLLTASPLAVGLVEWTPECQERAGRADNELVRYLTDAGFELEVLDDRGGVSRLPADVMRELRAGNLPPGWYSNLACRPRR